MPSSPLGGGAAEPIVPSSTSPTLRLCPEQLEEIVDIVGDRCRAVLVGAGIDSQRIWQTSDQSPAFARFQHCNVSDSNHNSVSQAEGHTGISEGIKSGHDPSTNVPDRVRVRPGDDGHNLTTRWPRSIPLPTDAAAGCRGEIHAVSDPKTKPARPEPPAAVVTQSSRSELLPSLQSLQMPALNLPGNRPQSSDQSHVDISPPKTHVSGLQFKRRSASAARSAVSRNYSFRSNHSSGPGPEGSRSNLQMRAGTTLVQGLNSPISSSSSDSGAEARPEDHAGSRRFDGPPAEDTGTRVAGRPAAPGRCRQEPTYPCATARPECGCGSGEAARRGGADRPLARRARPSPRGGPGSGNVGGDAAPGTDSAGCLEATLLPWPL